MPPTDEQRAVITNHGAAFVQACPGAGKTETIVGRVSSLLTGLPPRRGIAVLSFTNAALEEFTRRCREARSIGSSGIRTTSEHSTHSSGTFWCCQAASMAVPHRPNIVESWRTLGWTFGSAVNRAFEVQA